MTLHRLIPAALLALTALTLPACSSKNDPTPGGLQATPQDITLQFSMKGFAGSATEGSFGVALTEDDARAKRGSLLTGTINWAETNGGKEFKPFVLSKRTKGEKLWVYVTSDQPLTSNQTITLSWPVNGMLTLSSISSDNVAVQMMTVGQ